LSQKDFERPCRILYLVGALGSGGLERQLCYLLSTMDRERYNPVVVVWNYSENDSHVSWIRSLGVPIQSFTQPSSSFKKLLAFRRLVKELRPQIIHSYSFFTNFVVWWGAFGSNAIPLGSIRNDFISERRIAGRLVGSLSGCLPRRHIANSFAAKDNAQQFSWISKPSKIFTVRNGLDIDQLEIHPLPKGRPLLVAAGRLCPEKRWDRLLRTVARVADTGLVFSVYLAGEGPLRNKLEAQAKDLGVDMVVKFLGLRSDIPTLLKESAFLVHTADEEGCPNIVMEAMACGRAVVATDAGDVPYLVDDGKTGFVVRRGDDKKLAERMMTLIGDHQLCQRMGNAGRAKAEQEFKLSRLVFETLEAYRGAGWKDVYPQISS